jgi:hypothetical protein
MPPFTGEPGPLRTIDRRGVAVSRGAPPQPFPREPRLLAEHLEKAVDAPRPQVFQRALVGAVEAEGAVVERHDGNQHARLPRAPRAAGACGVERPAGRPAAGGSVHHRPAARARLGGAPLEVPAVAVANGEGSGDAAAARSPAAACAFPAAPRPMCWEGTHGVSAPSAAATPRGARGGGGHMQFPPQRRGPAAAPPLPARSCSVSAAMSARLRRWRTIDSVGSARGGRFAWSAAPLCGPGGGSAAPFAFPRPWYAAASSPNSGRPPASTFAGRMPGRSDRVFELPASSSEGFSSIPRKQGPKFYASTCCHEGSCPPEARVRGPEGALNSSELLRWPGILTEHHETGSGGGGPRARLAFGMQAPQSDRPDQT